MTDSYPVRFAVEYPERDLNRLSSAFRIFTVIPIAIVLASVGGYSASWATEAARPRPSPLAAPGCCSCRRC
jgi:hypothetical protein